MKQVKIKLFYGLISKKTCVFEMAKYGILRSLHYRIMSITRGCYLLNNACQVSNALHNEHNKGLLES